ncbi:hypothetical protein KP509_21G010800 [Ceratopteris richardii]|nr:hypothetical protein KP509_21G010800 [Ceratopteris richardii]
MSTAELIEIGVHGSASLAMQWVKDNVVPYVPATKIVAIAAGNEVVGTHDKALIGHMVPAMQNLHEALSSLNLTAPIQVSSPFSLGILHSSVPPSSATFKKPSLMAPFLSFLATTGSPFMANVYPFFAYTADPSPFTLDYALFNSSVGYTDPLTNLHYTGMFDAQLDAVYAAMAHMNFTNISIMVSETGWPSAGDPSQVGVNALNAQTYVNNLIKHVLSDKGTPLRPHQPLDAYIFSLFNEDLKPGPTSERHYGLFRTDFSPVYSTILSDSALLIDTSPSHNASLASKLAPTPAPPLEPGSPSPPSFSSRLVPAYFLTLPFLVCTNLLLV